MRIVWSGEHCPKACECALKNSLVRTRQHVGAGISPSPATPSRNARESFDSRVVGSAEGATYHRATPWVHGRATVLALKGQPNELWQVALSALPDRCAVIDPGRCGAQLACRFPNMNNECLTFFARPPTLSGTEARGLLLCGYDPARFDYPDVRRSFSGRDPYPANQSLPGHHKGLHRTSHKGRARMETDARFVRRGPDASRPASNHLDASVTSRYLGWHQNNECPARNACRSVGPA